MFTVPTALIFKGFWEYFLQITAIIAIKEQSQIIKTVNETGHMVIWLYSRFTKIYMYNVDLYTF